MDINFDFRPVYRHHDLLIELGAVEMAIDGLGERAAEDRDTSKPALESRRHSLLDALNQLAA